MLASVPGLSTTQESSGCWEVDEPHLHVDAIADNEEEGEEHDNSPANEGMFGKYKQYLSILNAQLDFIQKNSQPMDSTTAC